MALRTSKTVLTQQNSIIARAPIAKLAMKRCRSCNWRRHNLRHNLTSSDVPPYIIRLKSQPAKYEKYLLPLARAHTI
jgi:hypothetical protein